MSASRESLRYFADYIEKNTGIIYGEVNFYQLETRLVEVAKSEGVVGANGLYEKVKKDGINPDLKLLLLDIATNNETSFFRDMPVFKAVQDLMMNHAAASADLYQVWSAASSTGQELYSLAILVEEVKKVFPKFRIKILGTDISDRVLEKAQAGAYSQLEVQRGLSAAQLLKYFDQDQTGVHPSWRVKAFMKEDLSFKKLNLIEEWPSFGPFDLILCRNVLIYQNVPNKVKIIDKLIKRMKKGAYLVLGGAESLVGLSQQFDYLTKTNSVIYQLKD